MIHQLFCLTFPWVSEQHVDLYFYSMCLWDWEQPTICLVLFLPNNISNTLSRVQEVVPKVGVLYLKGTRHGKSKIHSPKFAVAYLRISPLEREMKKHLGNLESRWTIRSTLEVQNHFQETNIWKLKKNDDFFKVQIVWIVLAPCSSGLFDDFLFAFQKVPFLHGEFVIWHLPFGRCQNNPKLPGVLTLTKCLFPRLSWSPIWEGLSGKNLHTSISLDLFKVMWLFDTGFLPMVNHDENPNDIWEENICWFTFFHGILSHANPGPRDCFIQGRETVEFPQTWDML